MKRGFASLLIFLLVLTACGVKEIPVEQQPVIEPPKPEPIYVEKTEQVPVPVKKCFDSDNGLNKYERGVIENQNDKLTDSCLYTVAGSEKISLSKVAEYFCEGEDIVAEVMHCEYGCEDGACLRSRTERKVHKLIDNGMCREDVKVEDVIKVKACYNDCLSNTRCEPQELRTTSVLLPPQLNCLAPTDAWVVEKWLEFEVLKPTTAIFGADVLGGEIVMVEVHDERGAVVAAPIDKQPLTNNKCFGEGVGLSRAKLQAGNYVVIIGARGVGKDRFRSFSGHDFSVSIVE